MIDSFAIKKYGQERRDVRACGTVARIGPDAQGICTAVGHIRGVVQILVQKAIQRRGKSQPGTSCSAAPAADIAMFYSFFGTCAKNGIDPQKRLTYAIQNINNTKPSQLKYLLPQFIDKKLIE